MGDAPLTVDDLARKMQTSSARPVTGWRQVLRQATAGVVDLGESAEQRHARELIDRIRTPLESDRRIAVLSVKGGVGKTSTTIALGSTFATYRGDRVVAVDANPDLGTLADRVPDRNPATVRDLLRAPSTERYTEVRACTSQAPSRLEVVGSERDPQISEAFSAADYTRALDILRRHYTVIFTDCGTGLVGSAMGAVLATTDCLVLVATPALDGAKSAWATLDWLSAHGYSELVSSTVVVVNRLTEHGSDDASLTELFGRRCRAVHVIPFDPHIARGADLDIEQLRPTTKRAYQELAALLAEDFIRPSGRHAVL